LLPAFLDEALRQLVDIDLTICFAYPNETRPRLLHNGLRRHTPGKTLQNYLDGAYLLDPFYTASASRAASGLHRMREFAPDNFFEGEYVNSWEVHPCISMESGSLAEEIGYLVDISPTTPVVYSLMRANGSPPFDDDEFLLLSSVEPIVSEIIRSHWRESSTPETNGGIDRRGDMMQAAFERFGAGILSQREQFIVQMILRGHSTHSIAANLGIAEGTVKNHRKSIYSKLRIVSQQELFSRFMNDVLGFLDKDKG
jgi:DNA-binding CsgD family transcriptional regulator